MVLFMFFMILVVFVAMFVYLLKTYKAVKVLEEEANNVYVPRGYDFSNSNSDSRVSAGNMSLDMVSQLVREELRKEGLKDSDLKQASEVLGNMSEQEYRNLVTMAKGGGLSD